MTVFTPRNSHSVSYRDSPPMREKLSRRTDSRAFSEERKSSVERKDGFRVTLPTSIGQQCEALAAERASLPCFSLQCDAPRSAKDPRSHSARSGRYFSKEVMAYPCAEAQKPARRPQKKSTREMRELLNKQPSGKAAAEVSNTPQEWLNARLAGLSSTHFHADGVVIYASSELERPSGYDGPFYKIGPGHHLLELSDEEKDHLSAVSAVLVFCDIEAKMQMQEADILYRAIDNLGTAAPPMILVPHSMDPAVQPPCSPDKAFELLTRARDRGFDGVIPGEPKGFSLVIFVSNELDQQSRRCVLMNKHLNERRESLAYARAMEKSIEHMVWDYLRQKVPTSSVPAVNPEIGACDPGNTLCGFRVGKMLGEGTYGKVYACLEPATSASTNAVLKVLPKKKMTSCAGLKNLNNQLEVMSLLTTRWPHENVVKLYDVYHSADSILIRMQDGGALDLFKRLSARDKDQRRVLGVGKAAAAVQQCLSAICHLHIGPRVVHRDIKPENMIVSETENDITIRLTDFDLAYYIPEENAECRGMAGSFPFMAPEMILKKRYDPFAADIWSVALVCLETLCGVSIVKQALCLPSAREPHVRIQVTEVVVEYFEQPGSVEDFLQECLRSELRELFTRSLALLDGMLNVHPEQRWKATRIVEELAAHSIFPTPPGLKTAARAA